MYKEARGCGRRPEGRQIVLKDRKGEKMTVRSHCRLCYSEILSEKPLYLLDTIIVSLIFSVICFGIGDNTKTEELLLEEILSELKKSNKKK